MNARVLAPISLLATLFAPLARADSPRVFVLPVRSDSWLEQDDRLLEARVLLALGQGHRVRPLGTRDLPASARRQLPLELAECTTPDCLRALGLSSGAARVLGLELFDEGPARVLIATLYDSRTGEAVDRRELPRARFPPRAWADELARWVIGASAGVRPATPLPRPGAPLLGVNVAPEQSSQPEAQALAARLRDQLARRGQPRLAPPDADPTDLTHRAVITVEQFGVSERPHHLHRYRAGTLAANLTVSDTRTGAVLYTRRAFAELTTRARASTDHQLLEALVMDAVFQWMGDVDAIARVVR